MTIFFIAWLPQLIEKVQNVAVAFEFPRNLRSVNGKALLSLPHICSNRNIHERESGTTCQL